MNPYDPTEAARINAAAARENEAREQSATRDAGRIIPGPPSLSISARLYLRLWRQVLAGEMAADDWTRGVLGVVKASIPAGEVRTVRAIVAREASACTL